MYESKCLVCFHPAPAVQRCPKIASSGVANRVGGEGLSAMVGPLRDGSAGAQLQVGLFGNGLPLATAIARVSPTSLCCRPIDSGKGNGNEPFSLAMKNETEVAPPLSAPFNVGPRPSCGGDQNQEPLASTQREAHLSTRRTGTRFGTSRRWSKGAGLRSAVFSRVHRQLCGYQGMAAQLY